MAYPYLYKKMIENKNTVELLNINSFGFVFGTIFILLYIIYFDSNSLEKDVF